MTPADPPLPDTIGLLRLADSLLWLITCLGQSVKSVTLFSTLVFLIPIAVAEGASIQVTQSQQSLAFARYVASLKDDDPLSDGGPAAVLIQAALPGLYKDAQLAAVRQTGENERNEYSILYMMGDGTVVKEVMARYFELDRKIDDLPLSSILISPANYKFRFRGEVKTEANGAYVYDIVPKKKRAGLMKGQIWIDAETGSERLVTGHLIDGDRSVDIVRETTMVNGVMLARATHLSFTLPILGRAELTTIEYLIPAGGGPSPIPSPSTGGTRFRGLR